MAAALVVFSGGQDSTTCLYWALREFGPDQVSCLTFDYGQRHSVELDCARKVAALAGAPHEVLPIDTFSALGGNALTDAKVAVRKGEAGAAQADSAAGSGLPNTFVPARNVILLTFAAAYAYPRGIDQLVTGVAQTDYSGYPDCRESTIRALEQTLRFALEREVTIHTPLMHRSKRETVELAREVGALEALAYSHTCYEGEQPPCGACSACLLRAKGFREAGIPDPLVERFRGV